MPRLNVDGKGALPLATSLVDVAGSIVEDTEHGEDAVGCAIGASDVAASGPDVVDR